MRAVKVHQGNIRKVSALSLREDIPIYMDELYSKLDDITKLRIVTYVEFLSNSKFPVSNKSISRKLHGTKIYELRPLPIRLLFFMVGNDAVITHGFVKKKNSTDQSEIDRAETLKTRFLRGESSDVRIH